MAARAKIAAQSPATPQPTIAEIIDIRRSGAWAYATIFETLSAVKTTFGRMKSAFVTEDIFFGNRSKKDVKDTDFAECKKLAEDLDPIEEIVGDQNRASLEQRLRNLIALERVWDNLKTSELLDSFKSDKKTAAQTIKNIQALHPRAQLKLKKFYLVKAIYSLSSKSTGYEFRLDNFNEIAYPETGLRKEYLAQQIKLLFAEAAETLCHSDEDFLRFSRDLFNQVITENQKDTYTVEPPETAPELYKNREDRKEKPDDFVRRVYADYLGKGLLRPHLKALDLGAYQALYKRGFPDDFDTLLPTAQGRSVNDLLRSDSELLEARRATLRNSRAKAKVNR